MQPIDVSSVFAVVVPVVGVIVWLVRLEGRVNTNESIQKTILDEVKYVRARIDEVLLEK